MQSLPLVIAVLLAASGAMAQDLSAGGTMQSGNGDKGNDKNVVATGSESTMSALLSQGYEIKAAAPNGGKFVVFLQKDQSAYACQFSSLTNTRCGSIN